MKKIKILALVLVFAVLLSGCGLDFGGYFSALQSVVAGEAYVPYESMEYSRPDLTQIRQSLDDACQAAAAGEDVETVVEAIYSFYDEYDWFFTCYSLADIRYSADLTDIYWEKEYNFCADNSAEVDAMLEELYYALAQSPCREELEGEEYFGAGFFDSYEGDNMWDEAFTLLLEEEAALQSEYYTLSTGVLDYEPGTDEYYDACAEDMTRLLVELIRLRQEIAAYWGYEDYVQFANDFYYYRDYTPGQMADYLGEIQQELVPLYREMNGMTGLWDASYEYSSEEETLDFVRTAAENMGGTIWEAFTLMEDAGLYDIAYGENKYNSSFEVYLTSYYEPFIFMNPELTQYDSLTLAHEFGHFCNDYASYGSYVGVDVLEIFSQGMEYLSLCYGENTGDLTRVKMADSLCTYVEQAAFASFEQQMYGLTGADLSAEGLYRLYEQVALDFGFDSIGYDPREFVEITHFYTNPMYVFSYVVSNDAAMQMYQLEQEETGSGLRLMEENLDTLQSYFQAFLEEAGLESPFAEGRIQEVRRTFEEVIG